MLIKEQEGKQTAHTAIAVIKGMNAKKIENEQHHQHEGIIELLSYGDIPNTSAAGNVTERHLNKVVPGIELIGVPEGVIGLDDGRKCGVAYQVIDKLRAQW